MPLLKNNQFTDDPWVTLADDHPLPAAGQIILSLSRYQAEREGLKDFSGQIGLALPNTTEIAQLTDYLPHVALISLLFPSFADGRSYSLARQLRQAGFKGEIRATGNILPDQYQMMHQVGITAFVVSDRFPLGVWQKAGAQMSLAYQRGLYLQPGETEIISARYQEPR